MVVVFVFLFSNNICLNVSFVKDGNPTLEGLHLLKNVSGTFMRRLCWEHTMVAGLQVRFGLGQQLW